MCADLVFIQNGMLQPWLDERGLGNNTQVDLAHILVFLATVCFMSIDSAVLWGAFGVLTCPCRKAFPIVLRSTLFA